MKCINRKCLQVHPFRAISSHITHSPNINHTQTPPPTHTHTHCCTSPLALVAGLKSAEEGDAIARLPLEFPVADQLGNELRLLVQTHTTDDAIQPGWVGGRRRVGVGGGGGEESGGRRVEGGEWGGGGGGGGGGGD